LRGYSLALADVERRGDRPSETSIEEAREAGAMGGDYDAERPKRGFFARLFSRSKDPDDANEEAAPAPASTPAPTAKRGRAATAIASLISPKANSVSTERIVPLPTARPQQVAVAAAPSKPALRPMVTASLGLFDSRGYWEGAVQNSPDLPAAIAGPSKYGTAGLEPASTGSTALAYAAESEGAAPSRLRPMGARIPQEAKVMPAEGNTTVVEKPPLTAAANSDKSIESPWLRAAMLTPSISAYMTATQLGAVDLRPLQGLLYKPSLAVVMTFSPDPQLGMVASRFSGPAVVFLATTSFKLQSTASLR
jgi:hypothetical protein